MSVVFYVFCLHHSFCIILNVVLCSVLGTICVLQYNVLYWLVWYCLSGIVKYLKFSLEALVFLASISLSWDGNFQMRHTHIKCFHMTFLMKTFDFSFFSFHFLSSIYSAYHHHWIFFVHRCWCEVKYLVNSHGVE